MDQDNLLRFKQLQELEQPKQRQFIDTTANAIANMENQRQLALDAMSRASVQPQFDTNLSVSEQSAQLSESALNQGSIIPGKVQITQAFGNYNPSLEPNKSGRNWGVDFGVKVGTPLALPPGQWQVVQTFSGAKQKGRVGNRENSGYGNSVLVMNPQTGETMRFSHLSGVAVQPGKVYQGGTVLGTSGASGNVTGPHLDLEYKNAQGQFKDITKSPYARSIFGQGQTSGGQGMGGGFNLKDVGNKIASLYKKAFPSAPLNQFNNVMGMAQQGVTPATLTPEQKQSMIDSSMGLAMGVMSPIKTPRLPARVALIEKGLVPNEINATPAMEAISKLYQTHTNELGKRATAYIVKNIPSELDRINTMLADLKGLIK